MEEVKSGWGQRIKVGDWFGENCGGRRLMGAWREHELLEGKEGGGGGVEEGYVITRTKKHNTRLYRLPGPLFPKQLLALFRVLTAWVGGPSV